MTGLKLTAENIAAAAEQAGHEAIDFVSDFHASAEYRTHLTQVLAERRLPAPPSALGMPFRPRAFLQRHEPKGGGES